MPTAAIAEGRSCGRLSSSVFLLVCVCVSLCVSLHPTLPLLDKALAQMQIDERATRARQSGKFHLLWCLEVAKSQRMFRKKARLSHSQLCHLLSYQSGYKSD